MELSAIVCWLVAGLIMVGVDMLLGTFYLIVMGVAAVVGALAAWGGLSLGWQFCAFAVAAIVGSLIVSRFRSSSSARQSERLQNPDVGQTVSVRSWNADGTTSVQYRGAQWTACAHGVEHPTPGLWRIVQVQGTRLVIEPQSRRQA